MDRPKPAREGAEERLLRALRRKLARGPRASGLRVGIGDDAALWRPRPGYQAILTCDWFLEGTHFLADRHPPRLVGRKALARAASDVAAMGGRPRCFLASLGLPPDRTGRWLEEFARGLGEAAVEFRCAAAGGDTTRREEDILIHITVVGECREGRAVLRSGARPGDAVFVTGTLGEAAGGLELLRQTRRPDLRDPRVRRHLDPAPRFAAGAWLAERGLATAMMDLSDGLSTDLARLCAASGVGARIEARKLPAVRVPDGEAREALRLALDGGDDYELLFTVAAKKAAGIPRKIAGTQVTRIGRITAGRKILIERADSSTGELPRRGWDPFRTDRRAPVR
jgi:thiamine-monophosphate kinase